MKFVVPAIILAVAIILAPLIWIFVPLLVGEGGETGFGGSAVDSGARIELELMRGQIETLDGRVDQLEIEVNSLRREQRAPLLDSQTDELARTGPNAILDAYAQVVLVADRRNLNKGLTVARPSYLAEKLGRPRENLGDTCQSMTNPKLAEMLVLEEVGPIRVRMLQPAVDSLKRIFENIRATDQDLYDRINTAGALCVRRIRGSQSSVSTHAFGLALDINIDGHLDTLGDGRTQLGLTIIADFFNNEGWVWGAAFGREDSMHFEVSRQKLDEWLAQGIF